MKLVSSGHSSPKSVNIQKWRIIFKKSENDQTFFKHFKNSLIIAKTNLWYNFPFL